MQKKNWQILELTPTFGLLLLIILGFSLGKDILLNPYLIFALSVLSGVGLGIIILKSNPLEINPPLMDVQDEFEIEKRVPIEAKTAKLDPDAVDKFMEEQYEIVIEKKLKNPKLLYRRVYPKLTYFKPETYAEIGIILIISLFHIPFYIYYNLDAGQLRNIIWNTVLFATAGLFVIDLMHRAKWFPDKRHFIYRFAIFSLFIFFFLLGRGIYWYAIWDVKTFAMFTL